MSNYGQGQPPPQGGLPIYRPADATSNLIALARERMDFYASQVGMLDEALSIIIHEHAEIIAWYRQQIEAERSNIERMTAFASGGDMAYPMRQQPIQQPAAPQHPQLPQNGTPVSGIPGFNGEMSVTAEELQLVMQRRQHLATIACAQKAEVLKTMTAPGDNVPIAELGGKTKRQMVEQAVPVPQTGVSVVEFAPGEELPPEAKAGHMATEPRTATQLEAARKPVPEVAVEDLVLPPEPKKEG
jgi:hypothetical protein